MTEEIKLGVYERLLNDYESDKVKHAADLAYAACCLGDTITSEEIARNENAVTLVAGLPLAFSGIDEEIWKGYLSKPVNGQDKLKEFLEGITGNSDFDKLLNFCEKMEDSWYSKFITWVKFSDAEADFDNHNDTEKWKNEISPLWEQSKSDRLKAMLCLKVLFCGGYGSLYLEKPSEESKDTWHQSFFLAQKIIEDSIETFTNERTKNPFALFLIGNLLENAGWDDNPNYKEIYEYCGNMGLSQAYDTLTSILSQENRSSGTGSVKKEITDFYRKGALLGNAGCQYNLASRYESGKGVSRNVSEAIKWYDAAATQNINRYKLYKEDKKFAGSEMYLLYCYSKRLGKESEWFNEPFLESTFKKGNPASALILGEMEVDKNPSNAIALFQKAGDLGLALLSKIKLAELAEHGYYTNEKADNLYSQVLKSDDLDCTDNTYELFHTVKGIMRSGCSLAEVFSVRSSYYSNETSHLVNALQQTLKENREMVPSEEVIEPITDESRISLCQDMLRLHLVDVSTELVESIIGAQHGSGRSPCLWFEKYHVWSASWHSGDYYLNSFGIQSPMEQSHLSVALQINPAYEGAPGKTAGGFAVDKNNRIYLIHTGKIGGGKKGIGPKAFWNKYKGLTTKLKKHRESINVVVVAELGTTNFVQCIVEFVKFVANEIKGNEAQDIGTEEDTIKIKLCSKLFENLSEAKFKELASKFFEEAKRNPKRVYQTESFVEKFKFFIEQLGYIWKTEYKDKFLEELDNELYI